MTKRASISDRTSVASLLLVALFAACAPPADSGSTDAAATPPAAETAVAPRVSFIAESDLASMLGTDPSATLIAVGNDREGFEAGHLPGAAFVEFSALVETVDDLPNEVPSVAHLDSLFEAAGVSDGATVVFYGAPLFAARGAMTLTWLGHRGRTLILEGTADSWQANGGALETGEATVTAGSFTPNPLDDLIVDADWIASRLDTPDVSLLDARPEAQHTGETPGGGVDRPGHIPGSASIYWEQMTSSTDPLTLLPEDDLRALFAERGIEAGDTVVAYCRTGVQASMAWAVAERLGYETRIYDASFIDWSRRTDLPVER